jgi:hypothetical protein
MGLARRKWPAAGDRDFAWPRGAERVVGLGWRVRTARNRGMGGDSGTRGWGLPRRFAPRNDRGRGAIRRLLRRIENCGFPGTGGPYRSRLGQPDRLARKLVEPLSNPDDGSAIGSYFLCSVAVIRRTATLGTYAGPRNEPMVVPPAWGKYPLDWWDVETWVWAWGVCF